MHVETGGLFWSRQFIDSPLVALLSWVLFAFWIPRTRTLVMTTGPETGRLPQCAGLEKSAGGRLGASVRQPRFGDISNAGDGRICHSVGIYQSGQSSWFGAASAIDGRLATLYRTASGCFRPDTGIRRLRS